MVTGEPRRDQDAMAGWLGLILGLLALVCGTVWTVQGLGYVEGSVMTGQRFWAVVGPIVAMVGLVLIWRGMRARARR